MLNTWSTFYKEKIQNDNENSYSFISLIAYFFREIKYRIAFIFYPSLQKTAGQVTFEIKFTGHATSEQVGD